MSPAGHRSLRTTLLGAVLGILALTACGAPEYQYPKSTEHKAYLKVPASWQQIDQKLVDQVTYGDLDSAGSQKLRDASWTVAFDADPEPDVLHLVKGYPAEQPAVHAVALAVDGTAPLRGKVSFDLMRDFTLPVSEAARAAAEEDPNFAYSDFELLAEEILNPEPGLRGLREIFNYRSPLGELQTYDQTMLTNDDSSVIYRLMVRCSASCYASRVEEIQGVVESFTVRSK